MNFRGSRTLMEAETASENFRGSKYGLIDF